MIGEQIGLTLETEHGYVDLIAVGKALLGLSTRLNRAERLYACEQLGTSEGNLRKLRWKKAARGEGPQDPTQRKYCGQVEPPGYRYSTEAAAMMAQPGEWVLVGENIGTDRANTLAANIRRGRPSQFRPRGAFQSRTRAGSVWGRYVGG